MSATHVFFFVPTIIFLGIVVPTWLTLHYSHKRHAQKALTEEEREEFERLIERVEHMVERVEALEKILDGQTPEWRNTDPAMSAGAARSKP
jgi:phage shock protein B